MPIARKIQSTIIGRDYERDALAPYVKSFMDMNKTIATECGYDLMEEPQKAMNRPGSRSAWKKFYTENFMDPESFNVDPLMESYDIEDQKAMQEQMFQNDITAMYEHTSLADYNPVIGMVFPMHKNIMMNMVFDKGAIQKVVAEGPKCTLTMENRILRDTQGNEIDMYLEQDKMTPAIDASNPMYMIELALPERETTDVLAACGGTIHDSMSIRTHVAFVKLTNVFIAEGDNLPDENLVITNRNPVATAAEAKLYDAVWFPVNIPFKPGYNQFERSFVQPLTFTVRKSATEIEERRCTLSGTMDHNKFNIYADDNTVVPAIKLAAELDTSNAMLDTCSVKWTEKTTLIEIPNAIPINTTISPQEVKDIAALYTVNQMTKVMSLYKSVMANYKDDKIRQFLDQSYDRMPARAKGYNEFDYAVPEGYALDHVEHRYKTFFDFFDTEVTKMLQVLNDPNMVITVFGCPDLIRKITPTEYKYQTPSSIGPVELDFKRTVVTSDNRVYQFIGSDKLRWTDELVCILCPRNSNRVTYRIYDYQMYVSNEIRNISNPALPAIHAFERWLIDEYQPVQTRVKILNRDGRRKATTTNTPVSP